MSDGNERDKEMEGERERGGRDERDRDDDLWRCLICPRRRPQSFAGFT